LFRRNMLQLGSRANMLFDLWHSCNVTFFYLPTARAASGVGGGVRRKPARSKAAGRKWRTKYMRKRNCLWAR
jgi:hypothetical protein